MKKLGVLIVMMYSLFIVTPTHAQLNSRLNVVLLPAYQLPTGSLTKYYRSSFGAELKMIVAINDRQSLLRVSGIANGTYYRFGGKVYQDYDNRGNYNTYYTDGFGLSSIHGGIRADFGYNEEMPFGIYISQDFGLTHVGGSKGGARFGRTLGLGLTFNNIDMSCGFNSWRRGIGGQFHYFTFGCGYIF